MSAAVAYDLIVRQCRPVAEAVAELRARFPEVDPESVQDVCSELASLNCAEREALALLTPSGQAT